MPPPGERGATAVDVAPADFGELAVMRVGPDDRLERVMAAPRTARPHRRRLVVIRLDGIGGAAKIPIDDFRRALLDVIDVEEVDAAQGGVKCGVEAVAALVIDVLFRVPDRFVEAPGGFAHNRGLRRDGFAGNGCR